MSREMKDSGVEWIGEIPKNWSVAPILYGFSEVNNKNVNGHVKNALKFKYGTIIRKTNFDADAEEYVADTVLNYNIVNPGDIMINGLNLNYDFVSIRSAMVEELGIITSAYLALRPNTDKISSKYANYLFRGYDVCKAFHNMGIGMRKTLAFKEFKHEPCLFPSPTEQSQIVHFLDRKCSAIDTAIEKTKKSIEKLEEYKKAVITKAVTKGIDPNAKMKDSGVEWIGEIPEGWEVIKTKYLFHILKRIAGREGFDVISITQKGLKIKDITSNEGQVAENYSNYQFVFPGDFAMNHMDLLTGWVDLSVLTGVTSPDYRVFHKTKKSINDDYYKYVFQSLYFNKVYYGLAQGVAEVGRKRLQAPAFKELKLPCPPSDEPAKIAAYIKDKCVVIDALIEKKQVAINKWEEYKKSLIYYAVTGKIDCRNEVVK